MRLSSGQQQRHQRQVVVAVSLVEAVRRAGGSWDIPRHPRHCSHQHPTVAAVEVEVAEAVEVVHWVTLQKTRFFHR
jgi:hypothetical protein